MLVCMLNASAAVMIGEFETTAPTPTASVNRHRSLDHRHHLQQHECQHQPPTRTPPSGRAGLDSILDPKIMNGIMCGMLALVISCVVLFVKEAYNRPSNYH